ncbi:pectate lyase [Planomonospora sp. ID67723]|uniref:pectate lyase n=1 Tax=Planomonospora sp. ID67723 TaxID=2738134 RepID=UPI0018C4254E|nr:pectate lyase [Planomonospora sp. ID67723]MBG0827846.1 pectate lyase [Planomonospora sp. ID67723]
MLPTTRTLRIAACAVATLAAVAGTATPAASASAPAAGAYVLVNAASGLCLDVPGKSTADGAQLAQHACNGGTNQTWTLSNVSGGQRLTASHSGKCATIKDAGASAGKAVVQQACATGAFHTWRLDLVSGSAYRVVNLGSGKCLNVKDGSTAAGAAVQQNSCDAAAGKRWTLKAAGSAPAPAPTATAKPTPAPTATAKPTPAPTATTSPLPGWPTANGQQPVTETIAVSGLRDGGMKRFYGSGALGGDGQNEGQAPLFKLADGAVLQNVIIGSPGADGVHCVGTCTLKNVWWEDVGEDAATFKGTSAAQTMTIDGGGARAASDKVFQHNGPGTMVLKNLRVENFGKLYRSCGNCSKQYARHVVVSNVQVTAPAKSLVGINPNYGDTAKLSAITIVGDSGRKISICDRYKGVTSGEPSKTGSGPDGVSCRYTASDVAYR